MAYSTPGVYVEEKSSPVMPIAGVSTSTAGFVGIVTADVRTPVVPSDSATERRYAGAEPGTPVLVDSWETFRTNFGDIQAGNEVLALAVNGFFGNGGGRCWVVSVEPAAADKGTTVDGQAAKVEAALALFDGIDEISLVAVPGAVTAPLQKLIHEHCSAPTRQDRFAILDGTRNPAQLVDTAIRPAGTGRSDYAAMYFPWITTSWTSVAFTKRTGDDAGWDEKPTSVTGAVPPSGHVAGVYARVDDTRGVHKAPANEVVRGALGVDTLVGRSAQGPLNLNGINVIRNFGGNVTIWGARTMSDRADWRYVTSRRLFIYLRESIEAGTPWVVFEPNAPDLWSKIRRNVNAFLTTVWASGALLGATQEQAFYVRCDETTNPRELRDLGQVVTEIGVALVKPAEFVVFRMSQWAGAGQ